MASTPRATYGRGLQSQWLRWCLAVPPADLTRSISPFSVIGLSLLYASGYFLLWLMPTYAYFLPSHDYLGIVVIPSVISALFVGLLIIVGDAVARLSASSRSATLLAVAGLSVLALVALKGIMYAAGYDWSDRVPHGGDLVAAQRTFKFAIGVAVVLLIWVFRPVLATVARGLASLGYAFALLALVRLVVLWHGPLQGGALPPETTALPAIAAQHVSPDASLRRVVWIIFDETDFGRLFGADKQPTLDPSNFNRLARMSLFATRANSPASATLYSIPALLTGKPLGGRGVRLDDYGNLLLQGTDLSWTPFTEATSIFGVLAASGRSASILGFLHPYCRLFATERCEKMPWPEVDGWDAAIWANVPGLLCTKLGHPNYWSAVTQHAIERLPEYLGSDDALTFVHFNMPHLPAAYADKVLRLPWSPDALVEYSHNLQLADRVLGQVMNTLQHQDAHRETLLVVSTDHWLRNFFYQPKVPEASRPVPLIMWRVGETQGIELSQPVSTVHTAALILSFLDGSVTTQSDMAHWWADKTIHPAFIAPIT